MSKKLLKSKNVIVIYWANYKQKQLISIYNNKNGLITACIVYVLFDCNWVSEKKTDLLCLFFIDNSNNYIMLLCGSVVEHCVSSAKGCGFDSQGTHILMKMYNLNAIVSRFR